MVKVVVIDRGKQETYIPNNNISTLNYINTKGSLSPEAKHFIVINPGLAKMLEVEELVLIKDPSQLQSQLNYIFTLIEEL